MGDVLAGLNRVSDSLNLYLKHLEEAKENVVKGIIKTELEKRVPEFNLEIYFEVVNGFPRITISLKDKKEKDVIVNISFLVKDSVFHTEKIFFNENGNGKNLNQKEYPYKDRDTPFDLNSDLVWDYFVYIHSVMGAIDKIKNFFEKELDSLS